MCSFLRNHAVEQTNTQTDRQTDRQGNERKPNSEHSSRAISWSLILPKSLNNADKSDSTSVQSSTEVSFFQCFISVEMQNLWQFFFSFKSQMLSLTRSLNAAAVQRRVAPAPKSLGQDGAARWCSPSAWTSPWKLLTDGPEQLFFCAALHFTRWLCCYSGHESDSCKNLNLISLFIAGKKKQLDIFFKGNWYCFFWLWDIQQEMSVPRPNAAFSMSQSFWGFIFESVPEEKKVPIICENRTGGGQEPQEIVCARETILGHEEEIKKWPNSLTSYFTKRNIITTSSTFASALPSSGWFAWPP